MQKTYHYEEAIIINSINNIYYIYTTKLQNFGVRAILERWPLVMSLTISLQIVSVEQKYENNSHNQHYLFMIVMVCQNLRQAYLFEESLTQIPTNH